MHDLGLHCLHISHKKDARLKWVKGFRWLRVYKETRGIPMFEIILYHEVMKKAISSLWSHKYVLSTILSIFDTYFGHNHFSKPTIDPFSSHVDKPVHRISFFHSVFTSIEIIGLDNIFFECKIVNIFLPIHFYICFGYSKEPSH